MTSYLFPNGVFSLDRLQGIVDAVGKDKLVIDVRYDLPNLDVEVFCLIRIVVQVVVR